ncbi:VacJ family lipoprotein [Roseomonas hellenica]|uniref:VacJ family lipoprotein n=1 Tax=Plastoroseomonas hellenica TaxID=2687306 RepID=A0ABS5F5B6_9PROT|nr:VacJ family lipoprotein [Plastoroseomonas hellenica]MBR0667760.1 VacJ family lipoprotein [Plastoroseomonas hellenica]
MITAPSRYRLAGIVLACGLLGACAQVPADPAARAAHAEANDPAEPTNRAIFAGNQWVDRNAIRPVAQVYTDHVPQRVRSSVRNFARNLQGPGTLINDALQGNFERAWITAQRFAVNSTLGGLGLFDVATDWDLPGHQSDFGQTFGVWGAGPGASVQLPLFGASNLRDTAGRVVGMVANPLGFVSGETFQTVQAVGTTMGMVGQRADALPITNDLERSSLDYYAALRSLAAQRRAALVAEGRAGVPARAGAPAAPESLAEESHR